MYRVEEIGKILNRNNLNASFSLNFDLILFCLSEGSAD